MRSGVLILPMSMTQREKSGSLGSYVFSTRRRDGAALSECLIGNIRR